MSEKVTTPLRYIGSKRELTSWILEQIPSHENYVEPFGGSAAVLLSKPRSWKEIYNDVNGDLVVFFEALRDRPDDLREWLQNTPHSREVLEDIVERFNAGERPDETVEHAAWVFYILQNGYGASLASPSGFERPQMSESARKRSRARMYQNKIAGLDEVAERLRGVTVERMDYVDVLNAYDTPQTFFYLDPPYRGSEELVGGEDFSHEELESELQSIEAKWLLSYGHVPTWATDHDVKKQTRGKGMADETQEVLIANYDMDAANFNDVNQTDLEDWND